MKSISMAISGDIPIPTLLLMDKNGRADGVGRCPRERAMMPAWGILPGPHPLVAVMEWKIHLCFCSDNE